VAMRKVMTGLMFLLLCSFVVAEVSEIDTGFNVGDRTSGKDYVSATPTFWDNYGGWISGLIIVLIIVIVFLKKNSLKLFKKKTKRKTRAKKIKKKRKVSKKKK